LLAWILRSPDSEHILGDLAEEHAERSEDHGRIRADLWYWGQVARSVAPILRRTVGGRGTPGYDPRRTSRPLKAAAFAPGDLLQDARQILRKFGRRPLVPTLVVLTLGLGVGIVTSTFAVVHGVLLKPLPLPDAERLVFIRHLRLTVPDQRGGGISPGAFVRYRDGSRLLESVVAFSVEGATVTDDRPETVRLAYPTPELGAVVGLPPVVGRWNGEEDVTNERWVAVVSHSFWLSRYGADPGLVGTTIHLDGQPVEVIGVAPPETELLQGDVQFWVPLPTPVDTRSFGGFGWRAVGRLLPGATVQQLEAELNTLLATLPDALPRYERAWQYWYETFQVRPAPLPLLEERVASARSWIWLLLGAAMATFLVGVANVSTLAVARSLDGDSDVAVRAALGGGVGGLTRLFAVEACLLACLAATVGAALSLFSLRLLPRVAEDIVPRIQDVSLDAAVLGVAFTLSLLAAVVLTLIPVLRLPRDLASTLRGATQGVGRGLRRLQSMLLVGQIGFAAALVVFGGLMARSFWTLRTLDLGFPTEGLYTFHLSFPTRSDNSGDKHAFFRQLQERLQAIPGVTSVSASECVPLRCAGGGGAVAQIDDRWLEEDEVEPVIRTSRFTPGYFRTLGTPVRMGRDLTWRDAYTPDQGEVGSVTEGDGWVQAVRGTQRSRGPRAFFRSGSSRAPFPRRGKRRPDCGGWRGARRGALGPVHGWCRDGVGALSPGPPVRRDVVDRAFGARARTPSPRCRGRGLGDGPDCAYRGHGRLRYGGGGGHSRSHPDHDPGTLVGVYGALAHEVRRQRRELGIRNALGAGASELRAMVFSRAAVLVSSGLAFGLTVSALSGELLESVIYGVSSLDLLTYVAAGLLMGALGMFAAYVPAVRASRADPLQALRAE
jgi:predicted permease